MLSKKKILGIIIIVIIAIILIAGISSTSSYPENGAEVAGIIYDRMDELNLDRQSSEHNETDVMLHFASPNESVVYGYTNQYTADIAGIVGGEQVTIGNTTGYLHYVNDHVYSFTYDMPDRNLTMTITTNSTDDLSKFLI